MPNPRFWRGSAGSLARRCGVALLALAALGTAAGPALAQKPIRPWSEDILYFLLLDRFADGSKSNNADVQRDNPGGFHGGDFGGLTQRLDDLADLGVTAIWITPVMEQIKHPVNSGLDFEHWPHHGYWADDFSLIDPRFGTEAELKALVDAAHDRGIKVLLDTVYNHAGYGSAYLARPDARDLLRSTEFNNCGPEGDDLTTCVAGLPDFKTEKPEVAKWLIEMQIPRAKAVGLDGYRLDTVKHLGPEFWDMHRKIIDQELGQDFHLLGEIWGGSYQVADPYFEANRLDSALDFTFQGETLSWLQGRGRTIAFSRFLQKRHRVRDGHIMAHYLSSHDVPGFLYQLDGDLERFKVAAALQMASLGMPQIYYGEEVGRLGGDWPENRTDMPWGDMDIQPGKGKPRNEELRDYYKRIIAARRAHPAFSHGDYTELSTEGDLLVFQRSHEPSGDSVIVAANRSKAEAAATIPLPESWMGKSITDAVTGEDLGEAGAQMALTVPGLTARYLVVK